MDTLVTPSGIGAVRLWMSVSRLVEGCGARDSIPPPGATEQRRILVLGSEASGELIAFSQHGELQLVEGVMTRSPRYRTRAGIGAGATVASLVAAYPESCVQGDDNFVAVAPRGLNGISFDIGVDATALQNSMSSRTLQSLPDTARVSSVRLEGLDLGCEAPWTAMGHGDISQSAFAPSGARTMNDSGGRP